MTADVNRIQAVFQTALRAVDLDDQTAILDRECGLDTELRNSVEVLLRERDELTTVIADKSGVTPSQSSPSSGGTSILDPPTNPGAATAMASKNEPDSTRPAEIGEVVLDFLQPTTKPGSLGQLGHYEVLEVLGRGAFGIVVRAFDEKLQRIVAIKVLSPHLAATSPARKRFLREARASGCVRHENVVQIYAVEEEPLPYLVMEYIPGQTLQQKLDETGPLEATEVLRIGEQIARGLSAAHAQGLVHRDIKPGNILLEKGIEPKVKLTDFGLARAADDASLTQSGVIAGTPLFMAPEQAKGESLDHRADLFSLGSVMYTMASGKPPFRAATPLAVLKRVTEDTPRPIRESVSEVPQWLCDLIAGLHAKDPSQRFQSAAEVADLCARYLAHLQQPSQVARPVIMKVGQGSQPQNGARVAAVAVFVVLVAAVAYTRPWNSAGPTGPTTTASMTPVLPGVTQPVVPPVVSSHVLQERKVVRAALIDFMETERWFGGEPQDNSIRRADQCNAFLVRFDLDKLGISPKAQVTEATVSFYVWDPSSVGSTKVCAFPVLTEWDSETVTWSRPAANKTWQDGAGFTFGTDTGVAGSSVVVKPDEQGTDTVDPPIEYQLDVTNLVRAWLDGTTPNHGLAIAPVIDTTVDDGIRTRFQTFGPDYSRTQYIPKLAIRVRQ